MQDEKKEEMISLPSGVTGNITTEEYHEIICNGKDEKCEEVSVPSVFKVEPILSDKLYFIKENETEFLEKLNEYLKTVGETIYSTNHNFAHILGRFKIRKESDVLGKEETVFKFIDQEVFTKDFSNIIGNAFSNEFNKFKDLEISNEGAYEFIVELGRVGTNDCEYNENMTEEELDNCPGFKFYYPILSMEEIKRRIKLSEIKYKADLLKARKNMSTGYEVITHLNEALSAMKEKNVNGKYDKQISISEKNIEALNTYGVIKKSSIIGPGKRFPNAKTEAEKLSVLFYKANKVLADNNLDVRDFMKMYDNLDNIFEPEESYTFLSKFLSMIVSHNVGIYKVFIVKTLNDLIRLKYNSEETYGKEVIEKIRNVLS